MLEFRGAGRAVTCDGTTRRDFLRVGALGAMGLTLPQYLAAKNRVVCDPRPTIGRAS